MTTHTLYATDVSAMNANPVRTLYDRQPALTIYGGLLLILALVTTSLQAVDPRVLDGVDIWVKPTKFLLSVAVFALTTAWFFGYVRPERRHSPAMLYVVWGIIAFGTFEDSWIVWQAAHGARSHFNHADLFVTIMYALMGIGAVLLVATTLPLAHEIARRPVAGLRLDYRVAVVAALVLTFVLGGGAGMYMGAQQGHAVGLEGGHFPLFGWNRLGGDLRVAHFFGMHMQQALPLLAALVARWPTPSRWLVLGAGVLVLSGVALLTWLQAVMGLPFLPFVHG